MPNPFVDPALFPFYLGAIFVFGACFGSFFNVCIYRIPKGVSLSMPPSHCYNCGQPLKWVDNVPLLSYWLRRGRCRYCSARFSPRYFFIELLTALLWAGIFARFCYPRSEYSSAELIGDFAVVLTGLLLVSLLIVATFTDLDHWIIPDRISLGGVAAGIALSTVWPLGLAAHHPLSEPVLFITAPEKITPLINSVSGAAVGYGVLWAIGSLGTLVFRKEAMGQGDLKLLAMLGAFVGPINCLLVLVLASFVGTIFGGASLVAGKLMRREEVPASVAALLPDAVRSQAMIQHYELRPMERLVLTRAIASPGSVGPIRHHLPFGPSLALSGVIVYLLWEPMHAWFRSALLI